MIYIYLYIYISIYILSRALDDKQTITSMDEIVELIFLLSDPTCLSYLRN